MPRQAFSKQPQQKRCRQALAGDWPLAYRPEIRTLKPSNKDPGKLLDKPRENFPERAALLRSDGPGGDGGDGSDGGIGAGEGGGAGDGPYADISEPGYERLTPE